MKTRSPQDPSSLGPLVLLLIAVGNLVLWVVASPSHQPAGRLVGEFFGAEAVVLLSLALVLATLLSPIELAFGGLDRVGIWHRRVAVAGVLLLVPHMALVTSPPSQYATAVGTGLGDLALAGLAFLALWSIAPSLRAARWPGPVRQLAHLSHERWLTAHRLTGLFVLAAVVHGAIVDPVLRQSTVLRVTFLIIGGIGVVAYAYRELLARFVIPNYDYTVVETQRPNDTTLQVRLEPTHDKIAFQAGQFVFLSLGGTFGWQRHPFSVASSPSDRVLEVSIRSAGDFTRDLHEKLRPATPAKATGPFGGFNYHRGGQDQVWIAGGIGVTPFMSWIRSMDATFDRNVNFYYALAHKTDALYLDEIESAHHDHPSFQPHIVDTSTDGQLTSDKTLDDLPPGSETWIYMCGPPAMMKAFSKGFHRRGIPAARVRWEQFNIR